MDIAKKILTILLLAMIFVSCKKDDDSPNEFINVVSVSYDFTNGINNCNNPDGTGSVLFFKINYEVSEGIEIMKILAHIELSGGESEDFENLTFDDDGSQIERADCFRFGSNTWVDYRIGLESVNGIVSNSKTVRVDKPTGAL